MKKLLLIPCVALGMMVSGCVTVGHARRYGESRYWEGRFDSAMDCADRVFERFKKKLEELRVK